MGKGSRRSGHRNLAGPAPDAEAGGPAALVRAGGLTEGAPPERLSEHLDGCGDRDLLGLLARRPVGAGAGAG
ncbi:hypothetical protein PWG71_19370 [Nocardiopsis sp. N85]|uniref:hypothetical protein n=1 Tax=Nocardiopsis sp. N85 TaxID=3029400 RepID=UPI00237F0641|nr:hypothetical protein [Nocardiopsis sp. N85]MDE3723556.1 hypothetical protein [Nocardiopsis sp. N85]